MIIFYSKIRRPESQAREREEMINSQLVLFESWFALIADTRKNKSISSENL